MGQSKVKPKNPRGKPGNPMRQQEGNSGTHWVKIEKVPFDDLSDLFPITKVEFPDVFAGSNKKGPKNDRVIKRGSDSGEDDSETDAKMSGLIFPDFGSKDSDNKAGAGEDSGKRSSSELESDYKRDKSYFELEDSMASDMESETRLVTASEPIGGNAKSKDKSRQQIAAVTPTSTMPKKGRMKQKDKEDFSKKEGTDLKKSSWNFSFARNLG